MTPRFATAREREAYEAQQPHDPASERTIREALKQRNLAAKQRVIPVAAHENFTRRQQAYINRVLDESPTITPVVYRRGEKPPRVPATSMRPGYRKAMPATAYNGMQP